MPTAILESTPVATSLELQSLDWETGAGPDDPQAQSRTAQPTKVYRGDADEHWRGQTCHIVGASAEGELVIVLACGCRGSVPWWTLEPTTVRS
jgi:hypothetical protein